MNREFFFVGLGGWTGWTMAWTWTGVSRLASSFLLLVELLRFSNLAPQECTDIPGDNCSELELVSARAVCVSADVTSRAPSC